jgi:soluble cytochrome b562
MSTPPGEIGELLQKRRQRVRSWVRPDAHPLVAGPVNEACAALDAMAGMLGEISPALSRLLIESIGQEQQLRLIHAQQKARDIEKARQLRLQAQAEADEEQAALLESLARTYELAIDMPDMSDVRAAGVLLTASKLYRSAEQVSRSQDAAAIKTLGLKAVTTAGKWALKLTPVRHEDLQDLKDVWEALKTLKEPLDDATAILEAGRLRSGQAKAASSLFERLQVIRELAEGWCRAALQEPFFAEAIGVEHAETALQDRLQRARLDGDSKS